MVACSAGALPRCVARTTKRPHGCHVRGQQAPRSSADQPPLPTQPALPERPHEQREAGHNCHQERQADEKKGGRADWIAS